MIDDVLERAASKSYPYAATNLSQCVALADRVDWSSSRIPPHDDYLAELKTRHGRKTGFWAISPGAS